VATAALAAFLAIEPTRPLYAYVAGHNLASRRVLEKCGFAPRDEDAAIPLLEGDGIELLVMVLR
jgi:RimJ/RimL family protein N-acetyltransferase